MVLISVYPQNPANVNTGERFVLGLFYLDKVIVKVRISICFNMSRDVLVV